ncbi:hypothetical protein O9X98_33330, partial [Agrobacterium salinitolerans]|nr:hypothetical protein [Agrobacterium salinitolerans]
IDRMSFTSVSLTCFRLAIHQPLVQIEVQNGKTARAKVDLFMPKDCPGFTGIAVRELAEMLSRI